ncbi:MAG: carboxypeptidase-like regulatory domain-containing protein [Acidobacteriota bacterium]|nr:carboxypeptidase-like regulatory domain-containing protein [Acidobacteriota bacterium]
MPALLRLVLALSLSSLLTSSAVAQVVGGTIKGDVRDSTGAPIGSATVRVRNEETGTERRLLTDAEGRFAAPSVSVGAYTVTVEAAGFATERHSHVLLTVGETQQLTIALRVVTDIQQVDVVETRPTVNLSNEQVSGLVSEREVKELPLNGRSYDQLITLNPGAVNYTSQRSGSVGTSNSSVGNMFSISGRRPQDNLYLLNGVEYTGASLINVTPGGTSGQLLGVEAVREFNVVTDTYGASYGKRQGAQISIVTASGTNRLHGSAYEFLRNSALDARNYFDQAQRPQFERNTFGASLGGPIRHDAIFLFGNYEGYQQTLGLSDVTLVPNSASRAAAAPSVRPLLNLWPVANGPDLGSGVATAYSSPTQHIREDFGTTRADANLTGNDLLFGVYTVDDSTAHTPTQNPLSLIDERLREQVLSVQEQHVFSSRLLNTARFGFSRASFYFMGSVPPEVAAVAGSFVAGKPIGAIVIAGSTASNGSSQITGAGSNVGSNNQITRNLFSFDDHIYRTAGAHTFEAGGWLQRLQSNDNLAQNQYGQASFASLATFLAGTIKTFTVVPAATELAWRSWFGAGYIEDTWKALPRLELTAGLRVESTSGFNEAQGRAGVYTLADGVISTTPTVGSKGLLRNRAKLLPEPRFGAVWGATGDGKTAVRAGFGLHHSLLDTLDYRLDQAAPFNTTLSYTGTTVANPTSGAAGLISPSTVQTDLATPTTLSYTLKIERQLAPDASLTVGYIGSHGYHQILSENLNEPASIVCNNNCPAGVRNGTLYYPTTTRANPAVANTTSWVSGGSGSYNGLIVDVRRNLRRGLRLRGVYTFSKNLDNGSAWNTSVSANTPAYVSYPKNPALDYGAAATDVRHNAALNGSYDLPLGAGRQFLSHATPLVDHLVSGWTASSIVSLQSGLPFTPQLGYNPTGSGDTRNPVRPDVAIGFRGSLYSSGSTAQRAAHYFNSAAFAAPAYGTVGDLGRDTLRAPGYADWDLAVLKTTRAGEHAIVQFRAEAFNLVNRTNLLTPNPVIFSSGPTQGSASSQNAAVVASPTAGVITAAATSRQLQFGLKVQF